MNRTFLANAAIAAQWFALAGFVLGIMGVTDPSILHAAAASEGTSAAEVAPAKTTPRQRKSPPALRKEAIADEEAELSLRDTVIVTSVRVIFRQTVDLVDLDYVKDRLLEKIQQKDRKSYEKAMGNIFDDLDYLKIKKPLGLTRKSTKRETITTIRHTQPEEVVKMVEEIPDARLAGWINKEVTEKGLESLSEIRDYIYERVEHFVAEYTG